MEHDIRHLVNWIFMVTDKVRKEACEREGILKPDGYDPHHCFFKSEYKKDDCDDAWNIEPQKRFGGHRIIHHAENKKELKQGHELEIALKEKALGRYNGKYKEELVKILKEKKAHYGIE